MITQMNPKSRGRPLLWVLAVLLALGATATYFAYYPERMPAWVGKTPIGRELQSTTVYKWQDPTGAWHVSDQPPPAGVSYQEESYARDANVLPLPPELQR